MREAAANDILLLARVSDTSVLEASPRLLLVLRRSTKAFLCDVLELRHRNDVALVLHLLEVRLFLLLLDNLIVAVLRHALTDRGTL